MSDLISRIIAYEEGGLDEQDELDLFAELVGTGTIYSLQGCYQRQARDMISAGLIDVPA